MIHWFVAVGLWIVAGRLLQTAGGDDTDNFVGHSVAWLFILASSAGALATATLWTEQRETWVGWCLRGFTILALAGVILDQLLDVLFPMLAGRRITGTWGWPAFLAGMASIPSLVVTGVLLLARRKRDVPKG